MQSPFYRAMGGPYRGKLLEFGRNCSRTSSRGWKGIWKSRTKAGSQVEIRRVAGQERPHGRTPCSNRRRSRICSMYASKCTTTRRAQLVRREPSDQSSRLHRSRGSTATDDSDGLRVLPPVSEAHEHDNENEEKNEDDNKDEKPPDKPEDDDHDMQGGMLTEPDTPTTTSSGRGEKRTETQKNVFTKKRVMMKSPKRPITPVPPFEDPVKRRLMKKTDLKNNSSVINIDAHLLNVVNTHERRDRARDESRRIC